MFMEQYLCAAACDVAWCGSSGSYLFVQSPAEVPPSFPPTRLRLASEPPAAASGEDYHKSMEKGYSSDQTKDSRNTEEGKKCKIRDRLSGVEGRAC